MRWFVAGSIVFILAITVTLAIPNTLHICSTPVYCVNLPDPNAWRVKEAVLWAGLGVALVLWCYGIYLLAEEKK